MNWNTITVKFNFFTFCLCFLSSLGLTYQLGQLYNKKQAESVNHFLDIINDEHEELDVILREALKLKADAVIAMLTDDAGELISISDISSLEKIAEYSIKDKDISCVNFFDKEMKPFYKQKFIKEGVEVFNEKIVYENKDVGFVEVGIKFSGLEKYNFLKNNHINSYVSIIEKNLIDSRRKVHYMVVAFSIFISMLLFLTVYLLLIFLVIKPVNKLIEFAGRMRRGDFSSRLELLSNDEIGGVAEAFNELAAALEETTVSKDYIDSIFNSMTDMLVIVNLEGLICGVNRPVYNLLEYSKNELAGQNIDMLFEKTEEKNSFINIISRSKKDQVHIFFRSKKGNVWPVLLSFSEMKNNLGIVEGFVCIATDMSEINKKADELRDLSDYLNKIIESSPDGITVSDSSSKILMANNSYVKLLGKKSLGEIVGKSVNDIAIVGPGTYESTTGEQVIIDDDYINDAQKALELLFEEGKITGWESYNPLPDGRILPTEMSISLLYGQDGEYMGSVGITRDISGRKKLEMERVNIKSQLTHAEKLASVGQLAAGIAHEINTPVQYIGDNIHFLKESFDSLNTLIEKYNALAEAARNGKPTDSRLKEVDDTVEKIDLEYLADEIPNALAESLSGRNQISNIVRAMKDFSHPGSKNKEPFDLNKAILNVITVSRNEWKNFAEMVTDLSPDLPLVPCISGECNQVFLNMIINASHAIKDLLEVKSDMKGIITISSKTVGEYAEVHIRDNGTGIPEESRSRIFDPFIQPRR